MRQHRSIGRRKKDFFFEKKKQKTFANLAACRGNVAWLMRSVRELTAGAVSAPMPRRSTFRLALLCFRYRKLQARARFRVADGHAKTAWRLSAESREMANGTVKWFNTTKGYGFIMPGDGGKDVFVHITAVQAAGLRGLNDGQKVTYDVVMERGKAAATNLKLA
jgi:CspA family cold shock protein